MSASIYSLYERPLKHNEKRRADVSNHQNVINEEDSTEFQSNLQWTDKNRMWLRERPFELMQFRKIITFMQTCSLISK